MSIRYVCGPSGSGKSTYIQQKLINESLSDPGRKYLLIVPDQFTMQMQKRMIELHPDHAFSNIEILSFSRLSHRILEETGGDKPVLDDTGKSLIIRHISEEVRPDLAVMSTRLDRMGFIHEVKSAISEFMQYGIDPDGLHDLTEQIKDRPALVYKLHDLEIIYRAFMAYKADSYVTAEETLEIVCRKLHKSALVRGAVLAFDGFTGFTPVQERVIQELMVLADRVYFSFSTEDGADPHDTLPAEDMFYLSHRSVLRLSRLADDAGVTEDDPVIMRINGKNDPVVYITSRKPSDLSHLERNLFRYPTLRYSDAPGHIRIYRASNITEEITDTFQRISMLISARGYRYRDIAIVVGDMESYADGISRTAESLGIPVYMDYSRSVLMSPFIEAILSAYDVLKSDYSCESIIRHMRTGFGPLTMDETDELENFLLKRGIRGRRAYERVWTCGPADPEGESEAESIRRVEMSNRINAAREKVKEHFASLHNTDNAIRSYAESLYEFISVSGMYDRLNVMADGFRASGDHARAMQYEQVFDRVCDLLDQIVTLTGEERVEADEFLHILEAGLGEIRLGIIPGESDEIMVGDIVRTRLESVKVLFLLGANDDNIPGHMSTGGIISDPDRDYLSGIDGVELAPTPREQIFTQRLYLYMNMSKPTEGLIVSYSACDDKGAPIQASYLIHMLCKLFPGISHLRSVETHTVDGVTAPADRQSVAYVCADMMREYAGGRSNTGERNRLAGLCRMMEAHGDEEVLDRIRDMSTAHYTHTPLSRDIAEGLYGVLMQTSVSRLERFAGCAYAHFLSYGLKLRERPEYSFENNDMGDVYHKALEEFSDRVKNEGSGWDGLTDADADAWVDEIMDRLIDTYGDTILISNNRNIAMSDRLKRIVKRSVDTIRYQVTAGQFIPTYFERSFNETRTVASDDGTDLSYRLTGKIDRVDICENGQDKYLRIVDYKSGDKDFDIAALYHGLMMQLTVYMDMALKITGDTKPAGMLYYHMADPVVDADADTSEEEACALIRGKLKMKGVVNSDPDIARLMDRTLAAGTGSDVIPLAYKKDNTPQSYSKAYTTEELELMLKYAETKMDELTSRIMDGCIEVHPAYMKGSSSPCKWCDYASVCHIRSRIPGYMESEYDDDPADIPDAMRRSVSPHTDR